MTTVKQLIETLQLSLEKEWLKENDVVILLDNEQSSLFLDVMLPKVIISNSAAKNLIPKKAIGVGFITNPLIDINIELSDRDDIAVYNNLKSWVDLSGDY